MKRLRISAFVLLLLSTVTNAASNLVVERDAFRFRLPAGWTILNQNENQGFWLVNFSNQNSDVIQLSVSKTLGPAKFAAAKRNLKAGMGRDKSQEGWQLKQSGTIELAPFAQVDEEIYRATKGDLTSASYNIYGSSNIALFTFTLNRDAPDIAKVVRPLLSGFVWK
jgi:hypothetical protein